MTGKETNEEILRSLEKKRAQKAAYEEKMSIPPHEMVETGGASAQENEGASTSAPKPRLKEKISNLSTDLAKRTGESLDQAKNRVGKVARKTKKATRDELEKVSKGVRDTVREARGLASDTGKIIKNELIPTEQQVADLKLRGAEALQAVKKRAASINRKTKRSALVKIEKTKRATKAKFDTASREVSTAVKEGLEKQRFNPAGVDFPERSYGEVSEKEKEDKILAKIRAGEEKEAYKEDKKRTKDKNRKDKKPTDPEFAANLRAGLGAKPEDDASTRRLETEVLEPTPIPKKDAGTSDKEVEREIINAPKEEKEKIKVGLNNIGFFVTKKKNDFFAGAFNKITKLIPQDKRDGAFGRFCTEMKDSFIKDSKTSAKKAQDPNAFADAKLGIYIKGKKRGIKLSAGFQKVLANNSSLFGGAFKMGRVISDLTKWHLTSPLRYVMMGAMGMSRVAGAGKEVRFKNEELLEQTRMQDIDAAAEAAYKIYARAQEEAGAERNVSAEELKEAYLLVLPEDLFKRISIPSTANTFIQNILRRDLEGGVTGMLHQLDDIKVDDDLTPKEKRAAEKRLIKKYEDRLKDFDRALTAFGTVDGVAMGARYLQVASKTAVKLVTFETLLLSAEKVIDMLSHTLTNSNIHEVVTQHVTDSLQKVAGQHLPPSITTDSVRVGIPSNTPEGSNAITEALEKLQHPPKSDFDFNDPLHQGVHSAATVEHTTNPMDSWKAAAAGSEIAKSAVETHAGINVFHESIKVPTTFEIGKNPADLTHALQKIIMDRSLPPEVPHDGVVLDKILEARNLNEVANLQELMRGHDVAGIHASEIKDLIKFHDGKLDVDPKLYEYIDKLRTHSGDARHLDMFHNDPASAAAHVGNVRWAPIAHADNMHEGLASDGSHIHGIDGRPELTANQIYQEGAHSASVEETRLNLLEKFDKMDRTPNVVEGSTVLDTTNQTAEVSLDAKVAPDDFLNGSHVAEQSTTVADQTHNLQTTGDARYKGYNYESANEARRINNELFHNDPSATETIGRTLSSSQLTEMTNFKLQEIFSDNNTLMDVWDNQLKDGPASAIMSLDESNAGDGLTGFVHFMHKLQEVSGLDPKSANWFRGEESSGKFIPRALAFIAKRFPERLPEIMQN